MGKRKTTSTQTNKPIYSGEIEGAARTQQDAYNQAQPAISQFANNAGAASQSLFDRYQNGGDPATAAASDFITRTLGADPQNNPFLDQMIAQTGDSTRRAIQTQLGTRGGIGGSAERDIVSRNLANQELSARYSDFDRTRQMQMQAAGMAPGIAAAGYLPLQQAMQSGQAGAMLPLQASALNSASIGGLLGQYQDVKGTQTQSGGLLGQILSGFLQGGLGSIIGGRGQ
jgi:hypothetical protein